MNSVFIIIPVYNRKDTTLKCLAQLERVGCLQKFSVIVVDDGSSDGTSSAIKEHYPKVILLQGNGTLWWTGAISMGMKHAYHKGANAFVWLNDDCLVQNGLIESLVNYCQANHKTIVGAQGYELKYPQKISFGGKVLHWSSPLCYQLKEFPPENVVRCDMLSGNLVCLPSSVISLCGYPSLSGFPHYGGDTVYLQSAINLGYSLFTDTRKTATNILPSSSSSNISNWFTADGSPMLIANLVDSPQSSLYWKLFLTLNVNQFGLQGYFLFLLKYLPILFRISIITALRFILPHSIRLRVSEVKNVVFSPVS